MQREGNCSLKSLHFVVAAEADHWSEILLKIVEKEEDEVLIDKSLLNPWFLT